AEGTATGIAVAVKRPSAATFTLVPYTTLFRSTNAVQSTGGTLSATDVDSSAAFVAQSNVAGSNGFGKFSIGTDGVWTYTMNNASSEDEVRDDHTDSMTVSRSVRATQIITVTIH